MENCTLLLTVSLEQVCKIYWNATKIDLRDCVCNIIKVSKIQLFRLRRLKALKSV